MTESRGSTTTLSEHDAPQAEELPRPPDGRPEHPTEVPAQPKAAARTSNWTGGRITALVIGGLLVLISLVLLGAGGTALWADRTQREGGYVTTDVHKFSTAGSALATKSTRLGSPGVGWLYSPGVLGKVRIRVTPLSTSSALFVGIGRSADVDRYLAGVNRTVITEFWEDKTETVDGGTPASPPGTQDFWAASATGSGPQTVVWDPTGGSWSVVVMNSDGRSGIAVGADLGARMPALVWITLGVLVFGVVLLLGGGSSSPVRSEAVALAKRVRREQKGRRSCRRSRKQRPSSWPTSALRSQVCPGRRSPTGATPSTSGCASAAMTCSRSTRMRTRSRATAAITI